jgi:hypothetical protein
VVVGVVGAGSLDRVHPLAFGGARPTGDSASSPPPSTGHSESIDGGLDGELTRALLDIGRLRAAAFASASVNALMRVDEAGSPAHRADMDLVKRLRARGYRLEGVSYHVSGVQVLARRAEAVDVRAVVTTSGHRQVRTASRTAVPVPQDGPRPVIFTVVLASPNLSGPARWRIHSVRAA